MRTLNPLLLTLIFLCISLVSFGQAPQGVNYQAVARDVAGVPLINTAVNVQYDIRQSTPTGTIVYSETHSTTTNPFGLFTLEIGSGTPITGTFAGINWSTGLYYLQVTVNGDAMAPSQLLSVPYALHANTATSGSPGANGHDALADSVAEPAGTNCPNGGYLINMGSDDNDDGILQALEIDISYYICNGLDGSANNNDTSATNELQTISISNDTIFLSNGGFVVLPSAVGDGDWLVNGNDMSTIPSGNVGIGTVTPARKLAIESTSTAGDGLLINNSSTGNPGLMFQTQGNSRFVLGVDQSDNDKFKIGTTNVFTNTRFTINQFGDVGIGTTNPLHRLTVASTDTIVANFVGTNPNGAVLSVGALSPTAPVGAVFLSGSDSGIVALDPSQKTLFLANTTQDGHVGVSADSSVAMYGLQVANIAGDLIYNQGRRLFNETDTIYSFSPSGTVIHANQGSFFTDSLFVLGNNANNLNWVLANDGFGQAVWTDPNTLGIGSSLWQSNSPDIYFNTGNVGIGTITPGTNLHIESNTGPVMLIRENTPTSGSSILMESQRQFHLLSNELGYFKIQDLTAGRARFIIDPTGNVGIGLENNPLVKLHVADETQTSIAIQASHNLLADQSGNLTFVRSRGSIAAPTAVQANDRLGKVEWVGWNSGTGSFEEKASIRVIADEPYTGGSTASHMEFHVNPAGQSTTIEAMMISGGGNLGIGTSSPLQKLHIQNGTIRIDNGANPYTFPGSDGAANEVLTTDGLGNVSWQPAGGGGLWTQGTGGAHLTNTTDAVWIGTTNPIPGANLHIAKDGGLNAVFMETFGGSDSKFILSAAAGTMAVPSNILSGTTLGVIEFDGHQGGAPSNYGRGADIIVTSEADFSVTQTSSMHFRTMDASSVFGSRIVIDGDGEVGIGTTTPNSLLHVNGSVTITDGTEGAGKVLTSDASGNASWQTPPAPINWNANSSSTSIPAGTTTPVVFNNIEYVNGGGYNAGTGMFQAPVSGIYHVDATVTFDAIASSHEIQIQILRNGGTYKAITLYNDPTKNYVTAHISGDIFLPVNNTVSIGIYQNSVGPIVPTSAASSTRIYFNGHLVH